MAELYLEDFRFLNKSMLENNLVVFVGAGASMGSNYPSWTGLIDEIKKRLGISEPTDNLIVPQLYYNSRGEKDYIELVHELFYKPDAVPNSIHKKLVELSPKYIITTNYDNLIEQAFSDNGIFLDVIEKDSDLPYAHTDHILIKMHGGFKYNNFVLKEDDYLNYSFDFTLIENFIKSLFARYTVLFVGYSFNDPDTKQIVAWVRNVLKSSQQRAYIINIGQEYDPKMVEYYKNIGLNIIYANQLINDNISLTDKTVRILDRIIEPTLNTLAKMNKIFKGYDVLNFISGDYIVTVFDKYYNVYLHYDSISIYCDDQAEYDLISSYFDEKEKDEEKKKRNEQLRKEYPYIIKILEKSSIQNVIIYKPNEEKIHKDEEPIEIEISDSYQPEDISIFEEYDYISINNNLIHSNNADDFEKYLFKAYSYYFKKDYISCYRLLSKAARYYLNTNQLELYLITESNRINVGDFICDNPFNGISKENKTKIKNELSKINADVLFANYYSTIRHNTPIAELIDFKFIYKCLYSIVQSGRKVDKEARTSYALYAGVPSYHYIETIAENAYKFMQYNYLLLDKYSETINMYTIFIEYIFLSLSTEKRETDDDLFETSKNIVLENLSRFDIMVMLRFTTFEEIKNIVSKFKVKKIKIADEAYKYLSYVIDNLVKAYRKDIVGYEDIFVFNKLFLILTLIDDLDRLHDQIFEMIKMLLSEYNNTIKYDEINSLICKRYNEDRDHFELLTSDEIEQLLNIICEIVIRNNMEYDEYTHVFNNLVNMFHNTLPHKEIKINDRNRKLYLIALPHKMLIPLYSIVSNDYKNEIKEEIKKQICENDDSFLYYNALLYNIITPIEKNENCLYNKTKDIIDSFEKGITNAYEYNYVAYCTNLLFENKLINKDRFIKIIKNDKSLRLLVDPDNYEYDKFEPMVLMPLRPKSLQILSKNDTAYSEIHNAIKDYLSKEWDEELAKIYVTYFS